MILPCDGLRVLDFTWGMPGNLAAMILGDYGADVIKIEPPEGDPFRDHPAWPFWNRGKGSLVLNLKTGPDREQVRKLVRSADVVIESFRPGVMERLGLGVDELRELNPSLIYCSITGFGSHGPFAQLKGYEGVVDAKTGRMREFEGLVDPPRPALAAVPSASYGALHAAVQGILAALHVRRATHRGSHVETSLVQGNTAFDMIRWWAYQAAENDPLAKDRKDSWGAFRAVIPMPAYLTAVTKDGVWLQFANFVSHTYMAQMNALGLTDLYSDPRFANLPFVENTDDAEAIWEIVLERVREKTWAEWKEILDAERNVAVEPFLKTRDGFDHPQVQYNQHIIELDGIQQPGPIVKMSEIPVSPTRAAPCLGDLNGLAPADWKPLDAAAACDAPPAPLDGKLVLDFSTFYATPFGGALLADLGARVIKIEPPEGEVSRFSAGRMLFYKTTGGKESLAVDLKTEAGREIVLKLLAKADVVMHNFRPGAPERLGIGYEQVKRLNPKVIYHYGASYGEAGPYSFKPAMHPIPGAIAGGAIRQMPAELLSKDDAQLPMDQLKRKAWRLQKANEGNPDVNSALGLGTGLMLGIQASERYGIGQYQRTTMILSNLYANGDAATRGDGTAPAAEADSDLFGTGPLYRLYRCADGGWLFVAVVTDREWISFCKVIARPDWLKDVRFATRAARREHPGQLESALENVFLQRSADEWERLLIGMDVAAARADRDDVATFAIDEASNRELGFTVPVSHPQYGDYFRHGPIVTLDTSPSRIGPACEAGEDTEAILKELGYSDADITRLREAGIVGCVEVPV